MRITTMEATVLLEALPEEDCRFDHNRDCQEHGFFGIDGNCPVAESKELISTALKAPGRAPVVTDEAVEAAARGQYEEFPARVRWEDLSAAAKDMWRVGSRRALEAAAPLLGPRPLLDQQAVREKIADWHSAHYNPDHDVFYETDDRGVSGDEDENAMHAYRGFKWAQELARPMPTTEQIAQALFERDHDALGSTAAWREVGSLRRATYLDRGDAVLALLNGAES